MQTNSFLQDWQALFIPIMVMIISQVCKIVWEGRHSSRVNWRHINSYGGMPSSHTAMLVSLVMVMGRIQGWSSPFFAVTAIVAAIFIRDAVGIRWQLGFHGKIINRLIRELPVEERARFPKKKLEERLGHTPHEALVGGLVGLILTIILLWMINF